MKISNPQGKADLPLLSALQNARPDHVFEKPARDIVQDFCLSALVLGAEFRFKPVAGKEYFLYHHGDRWKLSLIGPDEWPMDASRHFVARCKLHLDMTWQLEPAGRGMKQPTVQSALERHIADFSDSLSAAGSVESALPFYLAALPYYQRVLASGLAVSLGHSILRLEAPERAHLQLGSPLMDNVLSGSHASLRLSATP